MTTKKWYGTFIYKFRAKKAKNVQIFRRISVKKVHFEWPREDYSTHLLSPSPSKKRQCVMWFRKLLFLVIINISAILMIILPIFFFFFSRCYQYTFPSAIIIFSSFQLFFPTSAWTAPKRWSFPSSAVIFKGKRAMEAFGGRSRGWQKGEIERLKSRHQSRNRSSSLRTWFLQDSGLQQIIFLGLQDNFFSGSDSRLPEKWSAPASSLTWSSGLGLRIF